jgi:uncharacterized protein YqgC (DUF456 family)
MMELLLLVAALIVGLVLIPFGLPGLWLMVGAALLYSYARPQQLGMATLIGITVLAVAAEALEWVLSGRYTRKYGGSRRAAWGAIVGGLIGAMVGVPIPVIGSVIGAFVGAFAGALVAELTRGAEVRAATRVATGALVGRAVAAAMKVGVGLALTVWVVAAVAWNSRSGGP